MLLQVSDSQVLVPLVTLVSHSYLHTHFCESFYLPILYIYTRTSFRFRHKGGGIPATCGGSNRCRREQADGGIVVTEIVTPHTRRVMSLAKSMPSHTGWVVSCAGWVVTNGLASKKNESSVTYWNKENFMTWDHCRHWEQLPRVDWQPKGQ